MPEPRQNYIYVDFENVREVDIDLVAQRPVKVVIALGKRQKTLPVEMVQSLLRYPDQVQLIPVEVEGKNALDFVLAYYIGQQSLNDPGGYFHILSGDKGFDSLVGHLRAQNILIKRHDRFADIEVIRDERFRKTSPAAEEKPPVIRIVQPPAKERLPASPTRVEAKAEPRVVIKATPAPAKGGGDRLAALREHLTKNRKNRPARRGAFIAYVRNFYANALVDKDCEIVLNALAAEKFLSVNAQNQISYRD